MLNQNATISDKPSQHIQNIQYDKDEYLTSFNTIIKNVDAIAFKVTHKYLISQNIKSNPKDFEFIRIKETYKLIIIPEIMLIKYFNCLSDIDANKTFKQYAIYVHPEQNSHPNAKIAFQKLLRAFKAESLY